jgi:hypothetical protein
LESRFRPRAWMSAFERSGSRSSARANPAARRPPRRCARRSFPALRPSSVPRHRRCCSPPPASTISTRRSCPRSRAAHGWSATGSPTRPAPIKGNLPPDFITGLERLTVGPNRPDLTLILDLAPEVGLKRAAERQGGGRPDRFESEGLPFHQTLRRAFLDIAAAEPWRCAVIAAGGTEHEVAAHIWSAVEARLDPAGVMKSDRS